MAEEDDAARRRPRSGGVTRYCGRSAAGIPRRWPSWSSSPVRAARAAGRAGLVLGADVRHPCGCRPRAGRQRTSAGSPRRRPGGPAAVVYELDRPVAEHAVQDWTTRHELDADRLTGGPPDWCRYVLSEPRPPDIAPGAMWVHDLFAHAEHDMPIGRPELRLLPAMPPGVVQGLQLVVPDVARARAGLVDRGVEVSEVQPVDGDAESVRQGGAALDNLGFVFFRDRDGNGWAVQQTAGRR